LVVFDVAFVVALDGDEDAALEEAHRPTLMIGLAAAECPGVKKEAGATLPADDQWKNCASASARSRTEMSVIRTSVPSNEATATGRPVASASRTDTRCPSSPSSAASVSSKGNSASSGDKNGVQLLIGQACHGCDLEASRRPALRSPVKRTRIEAERSARVGPSGERAMTPVTPARTSEQVAAELDELRAYEEKWSAAARRRRKAELERELPEA
jgi:hypothetical protein